MTFLSCHVTSPLVICVIQGHSPSPEPRVDAGAQEKATQLWTELLQSKEPQEFMVQASSHASCGREGSQHITYRKLAVL